MKVLHVPFTYHPDNCGGTEIYVAWLCSALTSLGVANTIAAPGEWNYTYDYEGVRVCRFAIHPHLTQDMMYGEGDPVAASNFAQVLDKEAPDLVHFHAFTPAVSVLCLREVQVRGLKAVSTFHTPTTSCIRATLLRWGSEVCDGEMQTGRCTSCLLHSLGMPRFLASACATTSRLTAPLGSWEALPNSARLALRASTLVAKRHDVTREWWNGMHKVIALGAWTSDLLKLNGVSEERIQVVSHGLPPYSHCKANRQNTTVFKFVFLGRLDPNKGLDLVVKALRLAPELQVTLDVYGIFQEEDKAVQATLALAQKDGRICIRPPVPSSQVEEVLGEYDCLLVPSRWLETGPLVVLEAFAAGIPVIGSDLGGIAEKVTHNFDGLLVSSVTVEAWKEAIVRMATETGLHDKLRRAVRPPRNMVQVADENLNVYHEILGSGYPGHKFLAP